jgi:hypothetical protein
MGLEIKLSVTLEDAKKFVRWLIEVSFLWYVIPRWLAIPLIATTVGGQIGAAVFNWLHHPEMSFFPTLIAAFVGATPGLLLALGFAVCSRFKRTGNAPEIRNTDGVTNNSEVLRRFEAVLGQVVATERERHIHYLYLLPEGATEVERVRFDQERLLDVYRAVRAAQSLVPEVRKVIIPPAGQTDGQWAMEIMAVLEAATRVKETGDRAPLDRIGALRNAILVQLGLDEQGLLNPKKLQTPIAKPSVSVAAPTVDQQKWLPPVEDRIFFVGDWLVKLGQIGLPEFVLRLLDDGTAHKCEKHGPAFKNGAWKYVEGEARIWWKADGTELLRPMPGAIDILEPVGRQARYGTYYGIPFGFSPIEWHPAERVLQERPATTGGISLGGQPLTKLDILTWLNEHDPAYNLALPSSCRTKAARPAEAKALYLEARTKAIEASLNPPLNTGDVENDLLTLRQWAGSQKPANPPVH